MRPLFDFRFAFTARIDPTVKCPKFYYSNYFSFQNSDMVSWSLPVFVLLPIPVVFCGIFISDATFIVHDDLTLLKVAQICTRISTKYYLVYSTSILIVHQRNDNWKHSTKFHFSTSPMLIPSPC